MNRYQLFGFIVLAGFLSFFLARIPGVFVKGPSFFTDYLYWDWNAFFFGVLVLNMLPFLLLGCVALTMRSSHGPRLFGASLTTFCLMSLAHGTVGLTTDAQEGLTLLFMPIYAIILMPVGYGLGWLGGWIVKRF